MSNKQEIIFDDGEEIRPQMLDPVQIERALEKVEKYRVGSFDIKLDGVLYRHGENGSSVWLEDGDEKKDGKDIGEIENGEPNGQGSVTCSDGGMYVGKWKYREYHGHGTFTYPKRTRCEWEYTYVGSKYVGDWKEGGKHGQGTYYFSWGGKLIGEFKENKA